MGWPMSTFYGAGPPWPEGSAAPLNESRRPNAEAATLENPIISSKRAHTPHAVRLQAQHCCPMAHEPLAWAGRTTFVPAMVHEIDRRLRRAGFGGVAACRGFGKTLPAPHDPTVGDFGKDVGGTYSTWLGQAP